MSDDPRSGVVDSDCRVHTTDNLYIAGTSVFPTSGHANPTLTMLALCLRLADHLAELFDRRQHSLDLSLSQRLAAS
jgi:choline dehydrogenase-like flavoprotein